MLDINFIPIIPGFYTLEDYKPPSAVRVSMTTLPINLDIPDYVHFFPVGLF